MKKVLILLILFLGCIKDLKNLKNEIKGLDEDLLQAVIENDKEKVELLIKRGANVNFKDNEGNTLLLISAKKGNTEIIKYLLKEGADINAKDKYSRTALLHASERGYLEMVKHLLEEGADINAKDKYDKTILLWASSKSSLEVVKYLLEKGADINAKGEYGNTSLLNASERGYLVMVKHLLEEGADINAKSNDGKTALLCASINGNIEIAKYLSEKGADINAKDEYNRTPLIWASSKGNLEIVKYLLEEGADINAKDKYGKTALLHASEGGRLEIAKYLSEKSRVEIVKYLLEKGANINAKSNDGKTALLWASSRGNLEIVKMLIENCCQIEKDFKLYNIIEETIVKNIKNGNIENSLLITTNYKNIINFNYKDSESNTFLHYIALTNNYKLFNLFFNNSDIDINILNNKGETPLYWALSHSNFKEDFIWYLLNNGAYLKSISYIKDKLLLDILLSYEDLCDRLIYAPLTIKLLNNINLSFEDKNKIKEIIKILKLKNEDFESEVQMTSFIKNTLIDFNSEINLDQIIVKEDDNIDVELNIAVFDEIFHHFGNDDYWPSIVEKGVEKMKQDFKKKLLVIEQYKPVNKSLLAMNNQERLQNTNFKRKKKLYRLLRLISKTAENGYNNDKIKFVMNQILDIVSCSEGSLEAIEDAIRYLSGEESTEIKDIINDELMNLRYNILKEICMNRIKIKTNLIEEIIEITPHTFPQLVKEMSKQLKLKIEYLDEDDYHFIYNKSEIINLALDKYKERIIEYIRDKIEENKVLWNKVRDYIEREIFKGRPVLEIEDFIYSEDYKMKIEAVKALLICLKLY